MARKQRGRRAPLFVACCEVVRKWQVPDSLDPGPTPHALPSLTYRAHDWRRRRHIESAAVCVVPLSPSPAVVAQSQHSSRPGKVQTPRAPFCATRSILTARTRTLMAARVANDGLVSRPRHATRRSTKYKHTRSSLGRQGQNMALGDPQSFCASACWPPA